MTDRPGSLVPPILDQVRREHGPFRTDEDLLLAALFMPEVLEEMRRAQRDKARSALSLAESGSIAQLVREASRISGVKHFRLSYHS